MRPALAIALILAASPMAAAADEAIPTAPSASASPPGTEAAPLDTGDQEADADDAPRIGPCGVIQDASGPDGKPTKPDPSARGAVEIGIGTGGYRHVRARVCKPVGEHGAVSVDVGHTEWDTGRRNVARP